MSSAATTAGQDFTAALRRGFAIGARTRWNRTDRTWRGSVTRTNVLQWQQDATVSYRGSESDELTAALSAGHTAVAAWLKHVEGGRIDPGLSMDLTVDSSPWAWTAFLGDMVDSGCSNVGEFEAWFTAKARARRAARTVEA